MPRGESSPNATSAIIEGFSIVWTYDMLGKEQIGMATLGSPEALWYLDNECKTLFFDGYITITLKPTDRDGRRYWYAYKTWDGKTYKLYVGKSETITINKLSETAKRMYDKVTS